MDYFRHHYMPTPEGGHDGTAADGPSKDEIFEALIMQESSGRPGVQGPPTRYGRAQGLTQVLPSTGQAMARRLGVPWRPDLMTGTSSEAADYQRRIGRAYFDEAWDRSDEDPREALMYYHGGPKLRGPNTRAYPDQVLRRIPPHEEALAHPAPLAPQPAVRPAADASLRRGREGHHLPPRRGPFAVWRPGLLGDLLPHLTRG